MVKKELSGRNRLRLFVFLLSTLVLLSLQTGLVLPNVTSLSTDKAEYYRGETVTISGSASAGEWVLIQVKDPGGVTVWFDTVQAGGDGSFSSDFTLSDSAAYGTYTVYATPPTTPVTTTFKVVEQVTPPPPPPPPPPPAKKSSSLTITVSETSVALGDSVAVSGTLTPALNTLVQVKITCPNGTVVSKSVSASGGQFTHVFKPDAAGFWSFKAYWPGNDEYYECTSNTVTIVVRGSVVLQVVVAPMMTNVGGTVIVYVSTSPPLADRPIMVSYITNKTTVWSSISVIKTGSTGVVALFFTPGETGKYRFKAEWIGDPTFTPASATSSEVLVIAEALAPEDILAALSKVKALQKLIEEKEAELFSYRSTSSILQKQVEYLQRDLSDAQSRISSLEAKLAETEARLSETESRLMFTDMVAFILGLIIGAVITYLLFRSRFKRRQALVGSPLRPTG